jgi:Ser/Thr protein kinase RdoA (MazF antagonist)
MKARSAAESAMSDHAAHAVLNIFSGCCTKFQLQRVEQLGFSGSALWKVIALEPTAFPNPLCLKRWPAEHPPPARLPWIHQVQLRARQQGLNFVAEPQHTQAGQTICEFAGSTWELMTWLPGEVDPSHSPAPARIAAAFRALAKFHLATVDHEQNATPHSFQPAPAFADRLARWQQLTAGKSEQIQRAVDQQRIPQFDDLARQWIARQRLASHSNLPPDLADQLLAAARLSLPLQPAIRDLWRDHVLFSGNEVSGFLDFGAMRVDTPLTDIARLLGSLAQDDATLRNIACDAYAEQIPLSPRERELIDLLDHSGTLIGGWNWLDWLYVEQRQFPSLAAVRSRLNELLNRRLSGFWSF